MNIFLWIIIGAALLHWIYEGIILPSLRLSLRYRLFALRDRLREVKFKNKETVSDDVFRYLQGTINNGIALLPYTDLRVIGAAEALEKDESLRARIKKREDTIAECKLSEIKEIVEELDALWWSAFMSNTAGFAANILPLIFVWHSWTTISSSIKKLVLVPEQEIEKAIPYLCPA
jgi:MoxR-like ATPase